MAPIGCRPGETEAERDQRLSDLKEIENRYKAEMDAEHWERHEFDRLGRDWDDNHSSGSSSSRDIGAIVLWIVLTALCLGIGFYIGYNS